MQPDPFYVGTYRLEIISARSFALNQDGKFISEDREKTSVFNQYFNSVFTTQDNTNLSSLHESIHFNPKLIHTIRFTPENVYRELANLKSDKACGPDCIPAQLLKAGADIICSPLSKIFQLSLDSGSLPRDWITANIVPVHKKAINIYPPTIVLSALPPLLSR